MQVMSPFFYFLFVFILLIILNFIVNKSKVYIDINKVLNESIAGKQAIKSLENEIKSKNKNFNDEEKKLLTEE